MVRLYLEDDAGNVRIVPMEADEVSIGRAEDNGIVLPDRNVSRHHARLRATNGRFFVEDAGARYGLFLNGSRVDGRREVQPGDLIVLGDYKIKVLPGEGGTEAAEIAPDRRGTVPAIPAMAEPEAAGEPSTDTSLLSLRDMERVARQGWPSDFEGRDEVAQKRSLTRRLIVLAVLVAIAVFLVWAYLWVTQPTEVETSLPASTGMAERTPSPAPAEPAEPVAPAPQPAPPPEPVAPEPEPEPPATAARTQVAVVEPAPSPARSTREAGKATERPEPPKPKEPPRVATAEPVATARPAPAGPATQSPPRAPAPPARPARTGTDTSRPATAATGDVVEAIEEAIKGGRLGEAEGLLARCRGGACWKAWKKLGVAYQSNRNYSKAVSAYKKAQSLVADGREKTRLQSMIDSLK